MKILIVEDEKPLVDILKDQFICAGFEVLTACDGNEALDILQSSQKINLVILDLLMPIKDGFDVLKEMRKDGRIKTIPVIVLSNLGQVEDIKRAMELGAMDYFVKSQHQLSEIVEKTKKLLENKKNFAVQIKTKSHNLSVNLKKLIKREFGESKNKSK